MPSPGFSSLAVVRLRQELWDTIPIVSRRKGLGVTFPILSHRTQGQRPVNGHSVRVPTGPTALAVRPEISAPE
jgi:hypothetical protein